MTDKLIDSFGLHVVIFLLIIQILLMMNQHPCIVDISACVDIEDVLIEIEHFRACNYHSTDVDAITDFNTDNCIEVTSNPDRIYKRGYFDFNEFR